MEYEGNDGSLLRYVWQDWFYSIYQLEACDVLSVRKGLYCGKYFVSFKDKEMLLGSIDNGKQRLGSSSPYIAAIFHF